jgi:hypothetical protein
MALSWNEIKDRALAFSKEWGEEEREHAESQSFWNDFFHVFGILDIQKRCKDENIPFFFKQWGGTNKKKNGRLLDGKSYDEMPSL